jgi:hypothetical protein
MARFQRHTVPWCSLSSSSGGACHRAPAAGRPRVAEHRQQRPVQPDAFGEQFQRPAAQPARSQRGAGRAAAQLKAAAIVDRLLEHGDPCLLPQPVAKEGG